MQDLFLESLSRKSHFLGMKCASYGEFLERIVLILILFNDLFLLLSNSGEIYDGKCSPHGETALMGGDFVNHERPFGLYYLQTRGESPFALFKHQFD